MSNLRAITRSRTRFLAAGVLGLCALFGYARPAQAQNPEFRAMWASRYEWPHADPDTCRGLIDDLMTSLADANFNAVMLQIRGQADVLYPSPYEVWSPLIGGVDPGWDPLAYALNAAHARGLEFHAYINTHTCWQSAAHFPPGNPAHLFYAHCNAADPQHRDWLHHNTPDNPVQFNEGNSVWMAPGVPAFQAYIRRQVLYVVENYDVDGVHFDVIRTPWWNQPSYDRISLYRFNYAQSNPGNLDFTHWTADQITRNVCDMYAAIQAVRPDVKVSAAVWPDPGSASTAQHQDALAWAARGGIDMLMPMMYFGGGAGSDWDARLQCWLAGAGNRHIVAGHITHQGLASLLEQISLTRLRGASGNAVFSWSTFPWWSDYSAQVYQTPAALPTMPWKDAPEIGVIYGYARLPDETPVVDAQVVRVGGNYIALSTGDGFFSHLLVPPGMYTLQATHSGCESETITNVAVAAGGVVRADVVFDTILPPIIAAVEPDPEVTLAGLEYTRWLELARGVAVAWELLAGPPEAVIDQQGWLHGWTPGPEDIGHSVPFTVRASNASGFDDESWSVQVVAPPPPVIVAVGLDEALAGQEYTRGMELTQGVAVTWELLAGPPAAVIDQLGRVRGWTPRPEDIGQFVPFTVRASNLGGFDDESWSVQVMPASSCTLFKITGFDEWPPGIAVLFRNPRFSGSTANDLALSPDVAEVTDAGGFSGSNSCRVEWQFVDTDPQRWMRLTTYDAPVFPNPTIMLDRPIRVRLRLDSGRLRLAVGIRETGTTAEVGADGGASGLIEWVGVTGEINGAPQGVLVEAQPGVWQTFIFDPLADPIYPMTGDGTLWTMTNRGTFEHLAFTIVDSAGPFTVYVDDIDLLCVVPPFGDLDADGDVTAADLALFVFCYTGPSLAASPVCLDADANGDDDVDLADFCRLQCAATGVR